MNVAESQAETTRPKRGCIRVVGILALGLLLVIVVNAVLRLLEGRNAAAAFHRTIATADRIVVRDGGFDCCGAVDDEAVLFEVTDPSEVKAVFGNLKFTGAGMPCNCCGFPGIDWYRGKERLTLTAGQHGQAIRFGGLDWCLSEESRNWLTHWLITHGVSEKEIAAGCGGPRRQLRRTAARMTLAQACITRGENHAAQGELDAAIAAFSEAIEHDVTFARAHYLRGLAHEEKGTLDLAIQDFTQAISYSSPNITHFRAEAAQCISGSDVPVELDEDLAPVYEARGRAYEKQGEAAKAEADLTQARKLERKPK